MLALYWYFQTSYCSTRTPAWPAPQGCDGTATFYNPDWQMADAADSWQAAHDWPPDPQWTESNWQQLSLRIYQVSTAY